jgi:hypothetical protein
LPCQTQRKTAVSRESSRERSAEQSANDRSEIVLERRQIELGVARVSRPESIKRSPAASQEPREGLSARRGLRGSRWIELPRSLMPLAALPPSPATGLSVPAVSGLIGITAVRGGARTQGVTRARSTEL